MSGRWPADQARSATDTDTDNKFPTVPKQFASAFLAASTSSDSIVSSRLLPSQLVLLHNLDILSTPNHRTMVHLTSLIAAHQGPFHTYEFFPPRTDAGLVNLLDRIGRLCSAPFPAPLAVSVTWGAGGGTADRTLGLAEEVVKLGVEVILHLTCTNMPKAKVDQALHVSGERTTLHFIPSSSLFPRSCDSVLNAI